MTVERQMVSRPSSVQPIDEDVMDVIPIIQQALKG